MIIEIREQVSEELLWESVWGSDGAGLTYWANKVRTANGDDIDFWKKDAKGHFVANVQPFKIHNYLEGKWYHLNINDLARGYKKAREAHQTHCGHFSINIEDADACFGDMVIQYAIYGELVYG